MEEKVQNEINNMITDMSGAPDMYRPTLFWEDGCKEIVKELEEIGIKKFRSMSSALGYFVPSYGVGENIKNIELLNNLKFDNNTKLRFKELLSGRAYAYADYRTYLASLMDSSPHTNTFSESKIGEPTEQFEFDNKFFSRSSLNYLLGINYFKKICAPNNINTVLEIGGGFGSLCEILLGDERNDIFYMDIDIPPTAYVATYYLQSIFGPKKVGDYTTLRKNKILQINDLKQKYSAAVLCPWQLPQLEGEIDLFVNYISFQEMEPEVVENYLHHVRRLNARYILLRNLREGKQIAKTSTGIGVKKPILGSDYDRYLPNYNLLDTNTAPFGFETIDGFHSELRVYCRDDI